MTKRRRKREKREEMEEMIEDAEDLAYSFQEEGAKKAIDDLIGEKIRDAVQKAATRKFGNHPALIMLPEFIEAQKGYGPSFYEDNSNDLRKELGLEATEPTLEDLEQIFEESELLEDIIADEIEEIEEIIEQISDEDLDNISNDLGEKIPGNEELETSETIYSFNFNQTDEDINKEIESTINALYGPTGEYIGQQVAGVLVGGLFNPPKVQINIRALRLAWDINPEIRDDLLNNTSTLAHLGLTAFRTIAIKQAFMKGRQGIKDFWKNLPDGVKGKFPNINKAITNWGAKGSKPWSIQGVVEKRIEELDDQRLEDLAEGLTEGFWEQFRQSVEYVYY